MMDLQRSIYNHSPIAIQNLFISFYGTRLKRLRYGQKFYSELEFLNRSQYFSAEKLRVYQENQLAKLITHCYNHVPHYRKMMDAQAIRPGDVSIRNLHKLFPILDKDELRSFRGSFRSGAKIKEKVIVINTSGTTGSPLNIETTSTSIQRNYAFFARFIGWTGASAGQPCATFAGRLIIPNRQKNPPFWRYNRAMNTVLFSSYHISDTNIPSYLNELNRFQPRLIDSYPSSIYSIARYINDHSIAHDIRPVAIITSSETLLEHQRKEISAAFMCPVFDQYGSAEMAAFICQCEKGSYHINPEYGYVEIVDEHGNPAAPDQAGALVCTGFINETTPLIRYRIGDSAILSEKDCGCGRKFPVIESLLGRTDDLLLTASGHHVGRLDPVFKGLQHIKESQIVQESLSQIIVRLVPEHGYSESTGKILIAALRERLGSISVSIEYVDAIPRTSAGKLRSVISKLSKN